MFNISLNSQHKYYEKVEYLSPQASVRDRLEVMTCGLGASRLE